MNWDTINSFQQIHCDKLPHYNHTHVSNRKHTFSLFNRREEYINQFIVIMTKNCHSEIQGLCWIKAFHKKPCCNLRGIITSLLIPLLTESNLIIIKLEE